MQKENSLCFRVWGKWALFSDPLTRMGGEKYSYPVPTYQALKGIAESIYWKPTFYYVVDQVRVLHPIRTQTKGMRPIRYHRPENELAIYTYLTDVSYQVKVHFEWNPHRPDLAGDRNENKHFFIAKRMVEKGGRRDIFLGARECQGYVEPCAFGEGRCAYDDCPELSFGLMFHGFDYPDETGRDELAARLWNPVMERGVITFPRPEACGILRPVNKMKPKQFVAGENFSPCDSLAAEEGFH